jgi:1-deoxy-D-xylulose-5-phosphate reductoisomerase
LERFPALRLAREAAIRGGTLPAVLNAANEIAVPSFLQGKIRFPQIWETVEKVMDRHRVVHAKTLGPILEADRWARQEAARLC